MLILLVLGPYFENPPSMPILLFSQQTHWRSERLILFSTSVKTLPTWINGERKLELQRYITNSHQWKLGVSWLLCLFLFKSINHRAIFVLTFSSDLLSSLENLIKRNPAPSHTHFISLVYFLFSILLWNLCCTL